MPLTVIDALNLVFDTTSVPLAAGQFATSYDVNWTIDFDLSAGQVTTPAF